MDEVILYRCRLFFLYEEEMDFGCYLKDLSKKKFSSRFPCCGHVYSCDICHEENSDGHEMVLATRMICGFCSREQPFSQKPCICGSNLTKKDSGAFWEGGKGTRDKTKMNRNDSAKYKGLNKTISNKKLTSSSKK